MKCFMHPTVEAMSVCKKCGKGMCINCSSYTNHSGICPSCKKEEFELELQQAHQSLRQNLRSLILFFALAIVYSIIIIIGAVSEPLTAAALVLDIIPIVIILLRFKKRKDIKARIAFLNGEISKIKGALSRGTKMI